MTDIQLIIDDDIITSRDQDFLTKQVVNNGNFPLYRSMASSDQLYYVHTMVAHHLAPFGLKPPINSEIYWEFDNILQRFCQKHSLERRYTTRAAVNLNFACNLTEICDPHVDNSHPHRVFILYLNDLPEDPAYNNTIIYQRQYQPGDNFGIHLNQITQQELDELQVVTEVEHRQWRCVCFDGSFYHAFRWPPPNYVRYACIINFF